jgi:hypothetical protein
VDAARAADFLAITRRQTLELARAGLIPAYPIGIGKRRTWRFRLSELAAAVARNLFTSADDPVIRNPSAALSRFAGDE